MVYEAAAKSHLKKLDIIQYRALRFSLGAVKTTHIDTLVVEASELLLTSDENEAIMNMLDKKSGRKN